MKTKETFFFGGASQYLTGDEHSHGRVILGATNSQPAG